jgi:2-polyprenyl-3-methyl-5-hydroxy-6-metoxy-1,4-benzoquinol methylase
MKYYESHEEAYRKVKKNKLSFWGESAENSESFENFYMKEYLISALDKIKPISNARVLEIGCGTGPISCFFAQQGHNVDGFDVSQTAIEIARKNAKERSLDIHYSIDDICSISKTMSDIYDIIIDGHCMHCITYDSDRHAALTNVLRLLKEGGYFIVETMSIEDPSLWPHDVRIDEKGIVWHEVKEDYPYDKVKFEGKYWICTRRIMNPCDLENELKQIGFLIEHIEIIKDEKLNMADFRAICSKPMQ